ncbi:MAG: hypothetical protein ACH37Z_14955 [Anaerolineae bacterium]
MSSSLTNCPCCLDGQTLCGRCDGDGAFVCDTVSVCVSCDGTGLASCNTCGGLGTLTIAEVVELARQTQDPALMALVPTPEQSLRLREMGFEHLGEVA